MTYIIIAFLGLAFGSFINAFVWRLHEQTKKNSKKLSIMHGRSMCPNCGHALSWMDLIPILSWLLLKGKCRYCKMPISFQYPLVEAITTLAFLISYIYWPFSFNVEGIISFSFWLVFIVGFVSLAIYDIRWQLLPNRIVTPLIYLALTEVFIKIIFFNGGLSLALGSLWGVLLTAGVFYAIFVLSNGKAIGGGDVKIAIVLGLLLGGPLEAILMIFIASVIGTFVSLILLALKKASRKNKIAFGPMLIMSTYICYLFGPHIINWYKNFII